MGTACPLSQRGPMRLVRRLLGIRSPSSAIMRGPHFGVAAAVIRQAPMEAMLGDVAETVARLRVQGIEPRAVAIRSGSLHGLEVVLTLPVVRLAPDSPVEWGVIS